MHKLERIPVLLDFQLLFEGRDRVTGRAVRSVCHRQRIECQLQAYLLRSLRQIEVLLIHLVVTAAKVENLGYSLFDSVSELDDAQRATCVQSK